MGKLRFVLGASQASDKMPNSNIGRKTLNIEAKKYVQETLFGEVDVALLMRRDVGSRKKKNTAIFHPLVPSASNPLVLKGKIELTALRRAKADGQTVRRSSVEYSISTTASTARKAVVVGDLRYWHIIIFRIRRLYLFSKTRRSLRNVALYLLSSLNTKIKFI